MIIVKIGDLFSSNAQTIVNTVNCVGVMGKGVALEAKKRFPDMFTDYEGRCKRHEVKLGQPYLYKNASGSWIVNFPTKNHWRMVSNLADIERGLASLKENYKSWGITSLAVPPLGCGHGQLEWRVVGPTLYRHFKEFDIPVEMYAPFETPQEELQVSFLDKLVSSITTQKSAPWRIEPALFALVEILGRIEKEPYHWSIGRTSFQKIAYFATETGIPTGLHYQRGSYGPYCADLKNRIAALVNNGLVREESIGQMFAVKVGKTYADARPAYANQIEQWEPAINKITDLFMRMNTTQAEIAATVHFVANEIRRSIPDQLDEISILRSVMQWKQKRRPPLSEKEVAKSIRGLNILSWLGAKASEDLPVEEEEFLNVE